MNLKMADDEECDWRLLARLGSAMARANRNDDAAVLLWKCLIASKEQIDRVTDEEGSEKDLFEARENFLVVINRLFQPIDCFRALRDEVPVTLWIASFPMNKAVHQCSDGNVG